MSYPNDFNCPIGLKLLQDPVICDDGITYEREAILKWFDEPVSKAPFDASKRISPMTKKLISTHLIPNIALKNSIEEYFKNNPNDLNADDVNGQFIFPDFAPIVDRQQPQQQQQQQEQHQVVGVQHFDDKLEIKCNGVVTSPDGKYTDVHLSLIPPNQGTKRNTVYINVVDVSGSMQLPAMNNDKLEGDFEYSRLDLVKYSLENIVENCTEHDYFSLVIFSNNAEVVMPITRMNNEGKKLAKKKIYEQDTQGATNLWGGLLKGLELAKENICNDKNVSMIVLTDGEANQNPPRGVYATLESYLEKNLISCSINTLGFGYDIDSQLLFDIALKIGHGTFCFIPDCTMIGTNVTSLIAKNKTCFAKSATLKIAVEGSVKWSPNYDADHLLNLDTSLYVKTVTGHKDATTILNFGPVEYGQPRDILIRLDGVANNATIKTIASYNICSGVKEEHKDFVLRDIQGNNQDAINELHDRNVFTQGLIELTRIRGATESENSKNKKVQECIKYLVDRFKKTNNEKFIREFETIKHEREGQIFKAVDKPEWFKKWGYSHLLYILSSHLRRFNSNFKDPSIQEYGGEIFETNRTDCETIFCNLQQPKPSIRNNNNNNNNAGRAGGGQVRQQVTIAQACCNIDAGCFTGDSEIFMKNGELKKVYQLQPNDELQSWNGEICKIKCILKTKCIKAIKVVKLNGLTITPYHPIYTDKWQFPVDICNSETINCDYVYNLVVDREHVVIINGIKCVTLGHGYKDNEVISHPYFGTNKVIEDLKQMKGWKEGFINVELMLTTRDENTGLINSLIQGEFIDCSTNDKFTLNQKIEIF